MASDAGPPTAVSAVTCNMGTPSARALEVPSHWRPKSLLQQARPVALCLELEGTCLGLNGGVERAGDVGQQVLAWRHLGCGCAVHPGKPLPESPCAHGQSQTLEDTNPQPLSTSCRGSACLTCVEMPLAQTCSACSQLRWSGGLGRRRPVCPPQPEASSPSSPPWRGAVRAGPARPRSCGVRGTSGSQTLAPKTVGGTHLRWCGQSGDPKSWPCRPHTAHRCTPTPPGSGVWDPERPPRPSWCLCQACHASPDVGSRLGNPWASAGSLLEGSGNAVQLPCVLVTEGTGCVAESGEGRARGKQV